MGLFSRSSASSEARETRREHNSRFNNKNTDPDSPEYLASTTGSSPPRRPPRSPVAGNAMSKARAANPRKGECRQCWAHAEDPAIHRKNRGDCQACIACAANGHAGQIVR